MSFTESDFKFMQQANRVLENPSMFRPALIEDINSWRVRGLGVGIYARFELSSRPLSDVLLVGVALPLPSEAEQRHLVILISGDMSVVHPQDEASEALYDKYFSSGITFKNVESLHQIANFNNRHIGSSMILRNNTDATREHIDGLVPMALDFAKTLKELKESDAKSK